MKRPFELVAEIQDKDAEIAAMAKLAVLLKVDIAEKDAEIEQLKALLKRAADALDNGDLAILDEMRKATQ